MAKALDPAQGEIRLVSLCIPDGFPQLVDHMMTPIDTETMRELLANRLVIMHNAAFDCAWVKEKFGVRPAQIFDTLSVI